MLWSDKCGKLLYYIFPLEIHNAHWHIKGSEALAGVAQWTECRPVNERVANSIPSLGRMPGLWARSPVGASGEAPTH